MGNAMIAEIEETVILVDGNERPRHNSEGRLIHATDEGIVNFWRWYGDSKLVDDLYRPIVHYHITPRDFDAFKPGGHDPERSGHAIWLSPNAEKQPAAHSVKLRDNTFKDGTRVLPVYVRMVRPQVLDDRLMLGWAQAAFANGSPEFPMLMPKAWVDEVIKDGAYDGILFTAFGEEDSETIVFSSMQLKSALGNSGRFDPEDPSLTDGEPPEDELDVEFSCKPRF